MPSTVIRAFSYDPESRSLRVTFVSGRRYRYLEVPPEAFEAMRLSFAKGEHFNRHIRDRFAFEREDDPPQTEKGGRSRPSRLDDDRQA